MNNSFAYAVIFYQNEIFQSIGCACGCVANFLLPCGVIYPAPL